MQSVSTNLQTELDKGQVDPIILLDLYEFYDADYTPDPTNGFEPADAVETFAAQEITWNGIAYRRELMSRGDISKSMGEKTNSVTLQFSNISRYLATLAQTQQIEGMLVVVRCVSPTVTDDSLVLFVGRADKPSDIDKQTFSLSVRQDFGNINATLPPNKFQADDPEGRLPNDPLFEGFPFFAIGGSFTFPQQVPSTSFFGRLFGRKKTELVFQQYSSVDATPYGTVINEVFGRCQMQLVPFAWVDIGWAVRYQIAACRGPIDSINEIKSRTAEIPDPFAKTIYLGDQGGTGTNVANTSPLGGGRYYSYLAYVDAASPSPNDRQDEAPVTTALIRGRKLDSPNGSGVFNVNQWTNNPVSITRFVMTDPHWLNIDPAFMEDPINWLTYLHCDEPILDNTNTQIIIIPGADINEAGNSFTRYRSSGLYRARYFLYNSLGDVSIVPELEDGPYDTIDIGDPVPDPSDPSDPTFISQKPLIKRYTANFPITEEVKAPDLLFKTVLPCFKGFVRVNKFGRWEIRSEQASDATRLRTNTVVADTSIPVLDVTPWKTGPELLKGRVHLGFGLTTSEVRTPSAAVYSTSGNSISLVVAKTGGVTITRSGATLSGGSTSVPATGTITIGGSPAVGDSVTAIINGIAVLYVLDNDDTTGTTAAMLAYYINANQRIRKFIKATWDSASPTIVTLTCLHGALTVPALLKTHNAGIADPTSAPTVAGASGGSLPAGTYYVAYSDTTAVGSTALTALATVVVTLNQKINVSSLPALVGTGRDFYISEKAGSTNLKYAASRTDASNFSILDVPDPGAAIPPSFNSTAEELIRVAKSFATNSQDIYPVWPASAAVILNDFYLPSTPNGHRYKVTTAGTTGTTEPSWPTTAGATVSSGSVVFTEFGSTILQQAGLTRANIVKGSFKWPLGSRQSSVNQTKGKFRDSTNDFALTPISVNDRAHQAIVKKTLPYEVDLSAVDNKNQALRILNFNLSKFREGDWFVSLASGPSSLVLEEGDPICVSDDSGGLINVVVRVEDLSIKANHDVVINHARKYSSLMFADDVGAHRIPIPSTLRFVQTKDSIAELIDTVAIRDSDALVPGFKVSVSHDLVDEGDWRGWALYADFGDGYRAIANGDVPAIMGNCTTTLGAVSDASVLDAINSVTFTLDFIDSTTLSNATEDELLADPYLNLFLIGDEYVQAATFVDNGNRSFTISNLLRGRFETDADEVIHSASERAVYINGAEVFVPMQVEGRVNVAFNYKFVTTNQNVVDATPISFTWTGNNVRPRKVSGIVLAQDGLSDWMIRFVGHPRPAEMPETYNVEIWRDSSRNDPSNLLRTLAVTRGSGQAALLVAAPPRTSVIGGTKPYSVVGSAYVNKNNVITGPTLATSLQSFNEPYMRLDFTVIDTDPTTPSFIQSQIVGLIESATFDVEVETEFVMPCFLNIVAGAGSTGDIQIKNYTTVVRTLNYTYAELRAGIRFSILVVADEYRVYRDYAFGAPPLAVIATPGSGPTFPLRGQFRVGSTIEYHDVSIANGNSLSTIYSSREQIEDFGVNQSVLFLRIYQQSRFEGIGNPVDV